MRPACARPFRRVSTTGVSATGAENAARTARETGLESPARDRANDAAELRWRRTMTKDESKEGRTRPALLVGAGPRPKELGAVLAALGAVRAEASGAAAIEPRRPLGLADLEELLAQRPPEGTLILDYERVPGEDIGFVRRFLERHAEWRLVIVGEDAGDRRARSLTALPRSRWLPWPPDLDQIGALLSGEPPPHGTGRSPAPSRPVAPAGPSKSADQGDAGARDEPDAPARGDAASGFDVAALVEERLAGRTATEDGARFAFEAPETSTSVARERGPVVEPFDGLLTLAVAIAALGPDGTDGARGGRGASKSKKPPEIAVRVERLAETEGGAERGDPADAVRVRMRIPTRGVEPSAWIELASGTDEIEDADEEVVSAVRAGRAAATELRALGARVGLVAVGDGELALDVILAGEPLGGATSPSGRRPKAQDPFA